MYFYTFHSISSLNCLVHQVRPHQNMTVAFLRNFIIKAIVSMREKTNWD